MEYLGREAFEEVSLGRVVPVGGFVAALFHHIVRRDAPLQKAAGRGVMVTGRSRMTAGGCGAPVVAGLGLAKATAVVQSPAASSSTFVVCRRARIAVIAGSLARPEDAVGRVVEYTAPATAKGVPEYSKKTMVYF